MELKDQTDSESSSEGFEKYASCKADSILQIDDKSGPK